MATPHPTPTDPRFKDLTGHRSGDFTARFYCGRSRHGSQWLCVCDAGHEKVIDGSAFAGGRVKHCPQCLAVRPKTVRCNKCQSVLPFTKRHFATSNQHPHGLRVRCKACTAPDARRFGKAMRRALRLRVLSHYSGGAPRCACCGEDHYEMLALDHVNGGGRRHHKEVSGKVLRDVERRGFPDGFRVLCHNCNQCHRIYGYCVHRPPAGVVEHFPLYGKAWRLEPCGPSLFASDCIHCGRKLPRDDRHFPRHAMMGDGLLNCCHDCNRHRQTEASRRRKLKQKDRVFRHYGGGHAFCACCGCSDFELLSVDHIDGGGLRHRREQVRGGNLYAWLIKNGFPGGFQILCYSCNQAKGFHGECPHWKRQKPPPAGGGFLA